jgi:hypothetical protein
LIFVFEMGLLKDVIVNVLDLSLVLFCLMYPNHKLAGLLMVLLLIREMGLCLKDLFKSGKEIYKNYQYNSQIKKIASEYKPLTAEKIEEYTRIYNNKTILQKQLMDHENDSSTITTTTTGDTEGYTID